MKALLTRPLTWIIAGLALVIVVATAWRLRTIEADEPAEALPPPPRSVSVHEVVPGTVRRFVHGEGTARAVRREVLAFEQSGRVVFIGSDAEGAPLRPGAFVQGPNEGDPLGQELARTDPRDQEQGLIQSEAGVLQVQSEVNAARAQVSRAYGDAKLAAAELERISTLFRSGQASAAQLQQARSADRGAKAAVAAQRAALAATRSGVVGAQAQLGQAKLRKQRASIYAPFDGVIAAMNVTLGQTAGPGMVDMSSPAGELRSAPFVLIDPSAYELTVALPTFDGAHVEPGQTAYVVWGEAALRDHTRFTPETPGVVAGTVWSVDPAIDPGARSVRVRIRVTEAVGGLRDGLFVTAWIVVEEKPDVPVVPMEALVFRDSAPFAFVVEDGTARRRIVEPGVRGSGALEARSGVAVGDRLVVKGRHGLTDDAAVVVLDEAER